MATSPYNYKSGPLAQLYSPKYDIQTNFYPIDIETSDNVTSKRGHVIKFYINTAENTKQNKDNAGDYVFTGELGTTQRNQEKDKNRLKIDSIKVNESITNTSFETPNININRKTKRIKHAITLYMPDTMNVQYSANWEDTSLTDALGPYGLLAQAGGGAIKDLFDKGMVAGLKSIVSSSGNVGKEAVSRILGGIVGTQGIEDFALFAGGIAINPQLEVLFKGVGLREFQFDFMFAPANRIEAKQVDEIIKTFKYHAAPEIFPDSSMGRYMVPPSEFDLEFWYNGKVNDKIHKVGTCVLVNINVDYAPNGWATFGGEQERGGGSPVQTRLTLQFRETEIVTKQRVLEDGY